MAHFQDRTQTHAFSKLAAEVDGTNRANAEAYRLTVQLKEALRPYIGKKIRKRDGTLTANVAHLAPPHNMGEGLSCYLHTSSTYRLEWSVKVCNTFGGSLRPDDSIATYHEAGVLVGKTSLHGVLEEVYTDTPKYRTDYTVAEVLEKRAEYEKAEQALSDARSALGPFDRR